MVKYYGRAKERTGSVNTNQIGLNMSGCVSRVGRTGPLANNVSMRSKCNVKFCGDVIYQGKVWATNDGPCVEKAPRTQSFNSGVGHRAFPEYKCGNKCTVEEFRAAKKKILKMKIVPGFSQYPLPPSGLYIPIKGLLDEGEDCWVFEQNLAKNDQGTFISGQNKYSPSGACPIFKLIKYTFNVGEGKMQYVWLLAAFDNNGDTVFTLQTPSSLDENKLPKPLESGLNSNNNKYPQEVISFFNMNCTIQEKKNNVIQLTYNQ